MAFRFSRLLQLALKENEQATLKLQAAHHLYRVIEKRLETITQLYGKYQADLIDSGKAGIAATLWYDHRCFLDHIAALLTQQKEALKHAHATCEQLKVAWCTAQRKVKTFETLQRQHQEKQRQKAKRHEQQQHDECQHPHRILGYR